MSGKQSARYNQDLANRFEAWCGENEKEAYPVSYDCVAGFLCGLAKDRDGSTKSLAVVLTALRARVSERGESWLSTHEATRLRKLMDHMRYLDTKAVSRKQALQLKHLHAMYTGSELSDPRLLEEAVILYMGHDGLLRSGELLSGLKVSDLVWSLDHSQFTIVLDRSKANRSGDGESVTIRDYEGRSAVKLMIQWFGTMGLWDKPSSHIFPSRSGKTWLWDKTLSTDWLRGVIKKRVAMIGLDAEKFSGHSLRAGGATDLFVARVPYFLIKKMGRWKSDAAMLYYRCEADVTDAVAAAFGRVSAQLGGGVC